jgi:hypothetical protein
MLHSPLAAWWMVVTVVFLTSSGGCVIRGRGLAVCDTNQCLELLVTEYACDATQP